MYNTDITRYRSALAPNAKKCWSRAASDYKNEINKRYVPIEKDEMNRYIDLIQHNDPKSQEYTSKIIDSLGPVIMKCALMYAGSCNYMDYVQDGACVVLACINKYKVDYSGKTSFMAYCISSIFNEYNEIYLQYHSPVDHAKHLCITVINKLRDFMENGGKELGVTVSEDDIKDYCKRMGIPYVQGLLESMNGVSIDERMYSESDSDGLSDPMSSTLESTDNNLDPTAWEEEYDTIAMVRSIKKAYDKYVEEKHSINKKRKMLRDLDILFDYYGVDGREQLSVDRIAMKYGITRERARQITTTMPETVRSIISGK